MNNPYLLKSQLKENEEELSNYLRDMNLWQQQMKRKEHSPLEKNYKENKKTKSKSLQNTNVNKINSWDYKAWEKFDVDQACEEIDFQNEFKKNDNDIFDNCLNVKVQSKQSEAIYEKNLGNALVQKQKWTEAILRYTRAIENYDKDPIFYANRALCYLKTNKFNLAINDCTSSLKLDSTYVKAYQRRSAAFIALEMYNEAKEDLNKILKLEPKNKQAKIDIEVVNNHIKEGEIKKQSNFQLENTNTMNNLNDKNIGSKMLCKDIEEHVNVISKWPSRVNCKQLTCKQKPPHLRSKKSFYSPKIKDVQMEELENLYLLQTTLKEVCEKDKSDDSKHEISKKKDFVQVEKFNKSVIPPIPHTYVQLKQDWANLQNNSNLLFEYLKQIPGKRLPSIIKNSMDNDLFVDILRILRSEFIQSGYEITDYLIGIGKLPRLQMLVMFCSDNEILCIKELLNHVSNVVSENTFKNLKTSFGL